jgi:hypothetical protein
MRILRIGCLVAIGIAALAILYVLFSTAGTPKPTTQATMPDAATRTTLLAFPSHPQWIAIPTDAPGMTEYLDKSSITTEGNIVSIWNLGDFGPLLEAVLFVHDKSFYFPRSIAHEQQFNCPLDLDHIVAAVNFTGHMAAGEMAVQPSHIEDWGTVTAPAEKAEYNIVCPASEVDKTTLPSSSLQPVVTSPQPPSAPLQAQSSSPPSSTGGVSSTFATIAVIILALYFLPWFVALSRHVDNHLVVLLVNFLFGLSGLGWLIALFMAISMETREAKKYAG